jgi:hypothetical protein
VPGVPCQVARELELVSEAADAARRKGTRPAGSMRRPFLWHRGSPSGLRRARGRSRAGTPSGQTPASGLTGEHRHVFQSDVLVPSDHRIRCRWSRADGRPAMLRPRGTPGATSVHMTARASRAVRFAPRSASTRIRATAIVGPSAPRGRATRRGGSLHCFPACFLIRRNRPLQPCPRRASWPRR